MSPTLLFLSASVYRVDVSFSCSGSGGEIEIVVTSTKDNKLLAVREAFQQTFGRATVTGKVGSCLCLGGGGGVGGIIIALHLLQYRDESFNFIPWCCIGSLGRAGI